MYKKSKKVYYRKKTASLTQKKIKTIKAVTKKQIKPALMPENLIHHTLQYLAVFLSVLAIFATAQVVLMYTSYQEMKEVHGEVAESFRYWEKVVGEHPNYPDGYYNAAVYAGMLGEKDRAIEYIRKAISLDPEFAEAKELENKIKTE